MSSQKKLTIERATTSLADRFFYARDRVSMQIISFPERSIASLTNVTIVMTLLCFYVARSSQVSLQIFSFLERSIASFTNVFRYRRVRGWADRWRSVRSLQVTSYTTIGILVKVFATVSADMQSHGVIVLQLKKFDLKYT